MDEFDEFDDLDFGGDVADEDLMQVYEAATSASTSAPTFQPASALARGRQPAPNASLAQIVRPLQPAVHHEELDDLPSDAFDSSFMSTGGGGSGAAQHSQRSIISSIRQPARIPSQQASFRQTTLLGDTLQEAPSQHTHTSNYAYVADLGPEKVTHHKIDQDAMKTWVYPTNLGAIRDYQFSIVKSSLFSNTLVALPTGLGKTFIAATVILNFYRWTRDAKLIFVAPTKPLVSQQVDACLQVAGIPRSETTLLTGETPPALREAEWASKRLFFMTPQTLQNDLSKGYADPKSIALLVIDEAHRSTGEYAYVKVIGFMRRFTNSFRVLALTATPGASVDAVQDVIDNLGVAHVEIRTEESIDIRNYVHSRDIERLTLEPSMEMETVQDLFTKALKPFCDRLSQQGIWFGRDAMSLTTFGLMKAQREWMLGPGRHANQGVKNMLMGTFALLKAVAHPIKLLSFHGIRACYDNLKEMRSEAEKDQKGSKLRKSFFRDPNTEEMMMTIERWLKDVTFESHPKLTFLKQQLADHFIDKGPDSGSTTRAIVFNEFRDSAEDIVRALNRDVPNVKASVFVGQADSKRSAGMKQAEQIRAIQRFKDGEFNVLVATSIGEEGLDIGQVDLIICYDASSSPIRMLQRMGRTGRKRAGRVILLLMKGKEEDKFAEAQDKYTGIQKLICDGARFNFRDDLSERIVPRSIKPTVDKRHVEIPIENTQNTGLPEPKKRAGRLPKTSKKKFHMPDDAETGFVTASTVAEVDGQTKLGFRAAGPAAKIRTKPTAKPLKMPAAADPAEMEFLVSVPDLETALESARASQKRTGGRAGASFSSVLSSFGGAAGGPSPQDTLVIDAGNAQSLGKLQRTSYLEHGVYTRRNVQLVNRLGKGAYDRPRCLGDAYKRQKVPRFVTDSGVSEDDEDDDEVEKEDVQMTEPKAESEEDDLGQVFAPRPNPQLNSRVNGRPATRPLPRTVVRPTRPAEPAPPSPEPDAKRRRTSGPSFGAAKKTQRERLTVTPYYGGSNENAMPSVKAEYDDDDDDGGKGSRWASKKTSAKSRPAVKGMTKWRSSQFQSYSFAGGRDDDDDTADRETLDDDDTDDFPKFSLKAKTKTTKARAALPQYNSRPAGSAILTRPAAARSATAAAKLSKTAPTKVLHERLMADFSESEGEKVADEDDVEMELELERDRERREQKREEERKKKQQKEQEERERQVLEREEKENERKEREKKEKERKEKERKEKQREENEKKEMDRKKREKEKEKERQPADDSFDFMDDDLEDMDALLNGNGNGNGIDKEMEAAVALVEVSDSDLELPALPPPQAPKASQRSSRPRPAEPLTDMSEPTPEPVADEEMAFLDELPDAPAADAQNDTVELPSFARLQPQPPPMITMSYPPAYGEPVTASYNPNSMYSAYNKKHGYKEHNDYNAEPPSMDADRSSQPVIIKFSQPAGTGNSLRRGPSRGRARASRGVGRAGRGGRGGRGGRSAREYSAILEDEAEEAGFDGYGYDGYDSYDEYGQGRNRGKDKGKKGRGKLEEQGDDCMRTSDNYESDGSDSGGDLVDFVVDDDEEEDEDASELPSSFVEPMKKTKKKAKTREKKETRKRKTRIPSSIASSPVRVTTLPIRLSQTMDSGSDVPVRASKAKASRAKPAKPRATTARAKAKQNNGKTTMPPPKSAEFILSEDDRSSDTGANGHVHDDMNNDSDESDVPVQRARRRVVDSSD